MSHEIRVERSWQRIREKLRLKVDKQPSTTQWEWRKTTIKGIQLPLPFPTRVAYYRVRQRQEGGHETEVLEGLFRSKKEAVLIATEKLGGTK